MSFYLPATGHSTMWGCKYMWSERGPGARLTIDISQEYTTPKVKGNRMRVTFNLEVKAEIPSFDAKQKDVFIKLMTDAAKKMYAQATLLSGNVSPDIKVSVGDSSGTQVVPLFSKESK